MRANFKGVFVSILVGLIACNSQDTKQGANPKVNVNQGDAHVYIEQNVTILRGVLPSGAKFSHGSKTTAQLFKKTKYNFSSEDKQRFRQLESNIDSAFADFDFKNNEPTAIVRNNGSNNWKLWPYYQSSNKDLNNFCESILGAIKNKTPFLTSCFIFSTAGTGKSYYLKKLFKHHFSHVNEKLTYKRIKVREMIEKLKSENYWQRHLGQETDLSLVSLVPFVDSAGKTSNQNITLNEIIGIKNAKSVCHKMPFLKDLRERSEKSSPLIIALDQMDEIHPDTAIQLCKSIEEILIEKRGEKIQICIFLIGRPCFASGYFYETAPKIKNENLTGRFVKKLGLPKFKSTGDLNVFMDNQTELTPEKKVFLEKTTTRKAFIERAKQHAFIRSSLPILFLARDTFELVPAPSEKTDQAKYLKENLVSGMFRRNFSTHGRPSDTHLDKFMAYKCLLRAVAIKYKNVDKEGCFRVKFGDEIEELAIGLKCNVRRLLERSGLVDIEPVGTATVKFRFQPFWVHRYLAESNPYKSAVK